MRNVREVELSGAPGGLMFVVGLVTLFGALALGVDGAKSNEPLELVAAPVLGLAGLLTLTGLVTIAPNEGVVLQLFGTYVGTMKETGLRWTNPFYAKRKISLRVTSWASPNLKVNDKDGNPIEIGCVVVFRVKESAKATFEVDDYAGFVRTQAEAALRNLASRHPYDAHDDELSLRRNTSEIAEALKVEIQSHIALAGIDVVDAKVSHLAYAPEIAHAMLQRQQASAVIAARSKIVEGAVTMVQMALQHLAEQKIVELDEERKAQMVSNLLVVLCSDRAAQPVINSGTIYS
jgi:regulator of protease activity HflC (stomatin/prohibitin superfamily)